MKPLAHVIRHLKKELPYISKLPVLGKGAFSIVYEDGPDKVIKVSMCNAYREFVNFMPEVHTDGPIQMPNVFDEEHLTVLPIINRDTKVELDLRVTLYRMERYKPFSLQRVTKEANQAVRAYKKLIDDTFKYSHADVEKSHEFIKRALGDIHYQNEHFKELMRNLNNVARMCEIQFDKYKHRNFGINDQGQAVLIDPLFDCRFYRSLY